MLLEDIAKTNLCHNNGPDLDFQPKMHFFKIVKHPECKSMASSLYLLFVILMTAVMPVTTQAQFVVGEKLPPQPSIKTLAEKSSKTAYPELVYKNNPLLVSLDCTYSYFAHAEIACSIVTPCKLFLELTAIEAIDRSVFVIGNVRTVSATIASIVLISENGGINWREPIDRYPGSTFEYIQFVNKTHGWIAGQQQQFDSSSRPLLLSTYNAGESWQRHSVSQNDEHTGTVLDVHFDSKEHGLMVIDRGSSAIDPFALYESMNGGRSWLIRQITDRKPALRNRPIIPSSPNWRIREDSHAASYKIEWRNTETWDVKSRFAINIGICNTME